MVTVEEGQVEENSEISSVGRWFFFSSSRTFGNVFCETRIISIV